MTILTVALKYLRGRLVASTLTAVSIALGVSLVVASVLLARGIKEGFIAGATDYNLVVGAKGSPTQLVLSVVFRMDLATPNIAYTGVVRLTYGDQRSPAQDARSHCRHCIPPFARRFSSKDPQR
jgi:putative ABC transport system permease protein